MIYQIEIAVVAALLFWLIQDFPTLIVIGFILSTLIGIGLCFMDFLFIKIIHNSTKLKAIEFLILFYANKKVQSARSLLRTNVYLLPVALILQSSLVYVLYGLSILFMSLVYYSSLGTEFPKQLENMNELV